jgi:hypothetical protein
MCISTETAMTRIFKTLLAGAALAVPLFVGGCAYETYPHRYTSYRYYDDDAYYRSPAYRYDDDDYRVRSYNYRVGAVWIPGHWYHGMWIRGHWE